MASLGRFAHDLEFIESPSEAIVDWRSLRTLDQWQEGFRVGATSTYRWYGPADVWVRFTEHAGGIARLIRRFLPKSPAELFGAVVEDKALPSALAWLFILCVRLDFSLSRITWEKFPGVCPYCLSAPEIRDLSKPGPTVEVPAPSLGISWRLLRRCDCATAQRQYRSDRVSPLRPRRECLPETLDEWQAMFEALYGQLHSGDKSPLLAFHFIEEMGEVATELRRHNVDLCKEELADVFSWILCIAALVSRVTGRELSVETLLRRRCADGLERFLEP